MYKAGETLKKNRFPQEPHKLVRLFWNNGFLIHQKHFKNIIRNNGKKRNFFGETVKLSCEPLFFFKSQQKSVLQQWAKACTITDLKVNISTIVFCCVCYFFPLTWKSLPATFGWPPGHYGSFPHTQTCTHMHSESGSLLDKPQYLGFSSSYLEFPLVCEMGTFSLTDQ